MARRTVITRQMLERDPWVWWTPAPWYHSWGRGVLTLSQPWAGCFSEPHAVEPPAHLCVHQWKPRLRLHAVTANTHGGRRKALPFTSPQGIFNIHRLDSVIQPWLCLSRIMLPAILGHSTGETRRDQPHSPTPLFHPRCMTTVK